MRLLPLPLSLSFKLASWHISLSLLPFLPVSSLPKRGRGRGRAPPLIEIATYSTAEKGERPPYSLSRLRKTGGTTTPFLEKWGAHRQTAALT